MPIKNLGVLAFAGAAVAAGHHQHARLHARGTDSGAAPAMPTGLPACWGSCFQKSGVSSPDALCDNEDVSNCIKTACATEDVASYEGWLAKQCNSDAPYPVGHNSTAVGPTATGGYSGGASTSICTETSTLIYKTTTDYSTYLITHTLSAPGGYGTGAPGGSAPGGGYGEASSDVSVGPATESAPAPGGYGSGAPGGGSEGSPSGGEGEECSDVTVTETERTTVTVTAGYGGGAPSSPAAAPSSPAAPGSEAPAPSSYAAPSSSEASPEQPGSYVSEAAAPSSEAPAPPSYGGATSEAPAPSSYAAPSPSAPASSSKPSSPEQSSPPTYDTGFRGKRGIAYNDSSMVVPALMDAGKIGWASNWEGVPKGFESSDITYIPTLHSGDGYWTGMWKEQAESAISQGLPYLFGPNEPDIPSQANMLPSDCADFWREWMEPYAGRIGLVAPSVSSGVGSGIGLDWLEQFVGNCSDCTFDAYNQHWYNSDGNDVQNFKDTVNGAAKYGPVFVGEFGAIGSDSDISGFMDEVMPWMDDNQDVL
ncbi:MAG: hypothetical protein INR62_05745, partial [Rhodospirillales bacterium]|nr:hypothetical protein [Acetobacter sp.]